MKPDFPWNPLSMSALDLLIWELHFHQIYFLALYNLLCVYWGKFNCIFYFIASTVAFLMQMGFVLLTKEASTSLPADEAEQSQKQFCSLLFSWWALYQWLLILTYSWKVRWSSRVHYLLTINKICVHYELMLHNISAIRGFHARIPLWALFWKWFLFSF